MECAFGRVPLMIIVRSGSADRAQNIRIYSFSETVCCCWNAWNSKNSPNLHANS